MQSHSLQLIIFQSSVGTQVVDCNKLYQPADYKENQNQVGEETIRKT